MSLVAVKCSQCGASIDIDNDRKFGYCQNCGTKYITEEIIKQYITNVENQTNIYFSEDPLETEKKQCEVLLICLENRDFISLKQKALEILKLNPKNKLANMLYKCNFEKGYSKVCSYSYITFQLNPITKYFSSNKGKVDLNFTLLVLDLIKESYPNFKNVIDCLNSIFSNVESLKIKKHELIEFYLLARNLSSLDLIIKNLNSELNNSNLSGFKTLLLTNNEYMAAEVDELRDDFISLINKICKYRNYLASNIDKRILMSDKISIKTKNELMDFEKQWDKHFKHTRRKKVNKSLIIVGVAIIIFIIILLIS